MTDERTKRGFAVTELKEVYKILFADVVQSGESLAVTPSDFANRSFVRTYFAYVEGVANALRQVTLASLDGTGVLTVKETDALKEQKRKKSAMGEETLSPAFMPMEDSLKFTFRCYAKIHGIDDYQPELGAGWESMLASIQIRHRLTHPKSVAALKLTHAEIVCIDGAREWWHKSVRSLLSTCQQEDMRLTKLYGTP